MTFVKVMTMICLMTLQLKHVRKSKVKFSEDKIDIKDDKGSVFLSEHHRENAVTDAKPTPL